MSTTHAIEVPRSAAGSLNAWSQMIGAEAKMVIRDTAGLIVPLGLPLIILFVTATGASRQVVVADLTALDIFVLPLVFTMVTSMVAIVNMPSFLAYYRRAGILRRLSVTPATPAMVLGAQLLISAIQIILGVACAYVVAMLAFGANPPMHPWLAVAMFLLATSAMYSVGMIVAALAPTPNASVAMGLVLFLGLGATGGMFGSRDALPELVAEVGGYLPFGAAVDVLSAAWAGADIPMGGVIGLVVKIIVGGVVSAVFFRWD